MGYKPFSNPVSNQPTHLMAHLSMGIDARTVDALSKVRDFDLGREGSRFVKWRLGHHDAAISQPRPFSHKF